MSNRLFFNAEGLAAHDGDCRVAGMFADILEKGYDLRVRVTGCSMAPFIGSGDIVTIQKIPIQKLRIGDLVLCRCQDESMMLHRLVRIRKDLKSRSRRILCTKGDAQEALDPPVRESDYLGRAILLERQQAEGAVPINMQSFSSVLINYSLALYNLFRHKTYGVWRRCNRRQSPDCSMNRQSR